MKTNSTRTLPLNKTEQNHINILTIKKFKSQEIASAFYYFVVKLIEMEKLECHSINRETGIMVILSDYPIDFAYLLKYITKSYEKLK